MKLRGAHGGDAGFITGLAGRLAEVSSLPWLPEPATRAFAAAGCQQAAAAIGQPSQLVLIATDSGGQPLGFVHALLDTSAFTGETVG
jgi:hypothetical protein